MSRRALSPLLALLVSACSTAPIVIPSSYVPPATRAKAPPAAMRGACPLALGGVRDMRPDPAHLGEVARRPVVGTNLGPWLDSGLRHALQPASEAALRLEVEVTKAYLASLNVAKSANLVVRARFHRGDALIGEETLRGANTSTNWASTENETEEALADAMRDLSKQLRVAADRHCAAASAPDAISP